jgi:hypothetical protein
MCVNRHSWEASEGKKREVRHSSTPDLEKNHYFSILIHGVLREYSLYSFHPL